MSNSSFQFSYHHLKSIEELTPEDQELVQKSLEATESSYAPYSNFNVGAVLQLENGVVISGSNQENAAYPSGLCAERVALFNAAHLYPGEAAKTLVVVAKTKQCIIAQPVSPCGSCRQVMVEFIQRTGKSFRLIMVGEDGVIVLDDALNLLPFYFERSALK